MVVVCRRRGRRATLAGILALAVASLGACQRTAGSGAASTTTAAPAAHEAPPARTAAAGAGNAGPMADAGPSSAPLPGLQLYELRVEGVGEASAGLPIDAAALREGIAARLPGSLPFLCGHGRLASAAPTAAPTVACPRDLPRTARTGLVLAAAALAVDDTGAPATLEAATQVLLQVRVHAERGDDDGRPIIGEAHVEAPLPLPPQRKGAGLAAFLAARAVAAAAIAASDAGGQLLVRELDDETVRAWLGDPAPWRTIAALREVGERAMVGEREAVQVLARRSRPDIVTVAAATLGRIGDVGSVPVLVAVLGSPSAEVCDAALAGLAELRSARGGAAQAATEALRAAASQHPLPWIRQRARSLLGSGDGAGDPQAPAPPAAGRAP